MYPINSVRLNAIGNNIRSAKKTAELLAQVKISGDIKCQWAQSLQHYKPENVVYRKMNSDGTCTFTTIQDLCRPSLSQPASPPPC